MSEDPNAPTLRDVLQGKGVPRQHHRVVQRLVELWLATFVGYTPGNATPDETVRYLMGMVSQ